MKPEEKTEEWPDSPDYFSKTNVESIIRDLEAAAQILGPPSSISTNRQLSLLVNCPGLFLKEDISKD